MLPFVSHFGQLFAPLPQAATLPAKAPPSQIVNPNDIKAGDVIGFSGNSWISALINIGTYGIPFSGISHVGVMAHAADGRLLLFESTTLEHMPCELSGDCFNGTQAHDLTKILQAYAGKVWHYPI